MTIRRITISVPDDVSRRIKRAAKDTTVSAWITEVVADRLDEAELLRQWDAFYADVAPRPADVRRANAIFTRVTRTKGRRSAA